MLNANSNHAPQTLTEKASAMRCALRVWMAMQSVCECQRYSDVNLESTAFEIRPLVVPVAVTI